MEINGNKNFLKLSESFQNFFYSNYYVYIIATAGIMGFVFRMEIAAIYFIVCLASLNWIFNRDLTPSFLAMVIVAMTPLARYGEVNYFDPLFYLPVIIVPSFIFHIVAYPLKFKTGRFFFPTLAVAIAITLGGLFSLSLKEYLSMPAMYYVFGLGFGMLIIYFIIESDIPYGNKDLVVYFSKMMAAIGIMGIAMVLSNYIRYGYMIEKSAGWFGSYFQWGNNLSNILLLSMPFSFYLATKEKRIVFYFSVGILQYVATILSLSRGGMLFGSLVFPFLIAATIIIAKKDRKKLLITLFVIIAVVYLTLKIIASPLLDSLYNFIEISKDEARVKLYALAWKNFLKYPVFGTGLAYNGKMYYFPQAMCIYWYHSTLFQILGSLGIAGVLAYTYQFIVQMKTLFEVKSVFNLFTLIAVAGFAGYSMVNVGYFIPFPCMVMVLEIFLISERENKRIISNI